MTLLLKFSNPFTGCDSISPDHCSCATWGPVECDACGVEIEEGEDVYVYMMPLYPWMAEDDPNQEWQGYTWHKSCDTGSLPSLAAEDCRG